MNMIKSLSLIVALLIAPVLEATERLENPKSAGAKDSSAVAAGLGAEGIRARLLQVSADLPILSIEPSLLTGFWEVLLPGGQTLFVSDSGDYFVAGELFGITNNNFVNITEQGRDGERKTLLDSLNEKDMVIFKPANGEPKAVVTVFTDIDCGFCRKLHQEVPELNRLGIEVRYLAYPRAGIGSPSYDKLVSAWCAENPQMALTLAKGGTELPARTCANKVAAQYQLGSEMGVTGTPSLVFEDGRMQAGYLPADRLAAILGLN
jgi:thiol:disulfide interchange protein DsbC